MTMLTRYQKQTRLPHSHFVSTSATTENYTIFYFYFVILYSLRLRLSAFASHKMYMCVDLGRDRIWVSEQWAALMRRSFSFSLSLLCIFLLRDFVEYSPKTKQRKLKKISFARFPLILVHISIRCMIFCESILFLPIYMLSVLRCFVRVESLSQSQSTVKSTRRKLRSERKKKCKVVFSCVQRSERKKETKSRHKDSSEEKCAFSLHSSARSVNL